MIPCLLIITLAAPQLVDAARFEGALLAGSSGGGLFRVLDDGSLDPVDLGLADGERDIRAVEVVDDILWLGTEAGLILVARDMCGITVHRRSDLPVTSLAGGSGGLAVAADDGVYLLDGTKEVWRVSRRFSTVAWWLGRLVAAGADGVFEVDREGARPLRREGAVTALFSDGVRLLLGGADGGVVALYQHQPAALIANLDARVTVLWTHNDAVWIGGVDVPLLRVPEREPAERLPVSGTVWGLVAAVDHVLALTDDGLATVSDERGVAYQYAVDHAGATAGRSL